MPWKISRHGGCHLQWLSPILVGGIPTPLKNISQLGWWHSQLNGKSLKFHGSSNHQPEIYPNSQDLWLKICETHVGAMVIYPIMKIHYQPGQAWDHPPLMSWFYHWMASILGNLQARVFFYHQILYSFPLSNFPPKKKKWSNPSLFTGYESAIVPYCSSPHCRFQQLSCYLQLRVIDVEPGHVCTWLNNIDMKPEKHPHFSSNGSEKKTAWKCGF